MSSDARDPTARPAADTPAASTPESATPESVAQEPTAQGPAAPRLSASVITRYAIGSIGTGGFATLPGLVLTYYLTDSLGVAALAAGVVITAAKIWDVVIDPVVGALSDRDLARRGIRRRGMLIGAIAIPFLFALTFAAPPALGHIWGAVWVLVAFVLTATAFSLFQVPYIALPAELTDGYDERTRLLTWRVVVLTLAILLFGAGGPALRDMVASPVLGYLLMGIVCGVALGVGMLVSTTVARHARRPADPQSARARAPLNVRAHYAAGIAALRRSTPFRMLLSAYLLQALATGLMLAGAQYVATWVMHSQAAVQLLFIALIAPAFLAAPVWGKISDRLGKERTFRIASVLFALAAASLIGQLWGAGGWVYAPVAVAGIAYAGLQSLPMAMLPDVIAHDEREHGPGRGGSFSGVWTAGETIGFALGAAVLSIILAITGYVSSVAGSQVVQPVAAVNGIIVSFSVVPALLVVASLFFLARYRLRRADIEVPAAAR